jgi:hypothetical protein
MKSTRVVARRMRGRWRLCWAASGRLARDAQGQPFDRGGCGEERAVYARWVARAIGANLARRPAMLATEVDDGIC